LVADFSDIQKGYYHLYFGKIERKSLYEVCCSKKQVVLLGEAGAGKSIVLKQLAAEVSDSEYYPVYFDLKHYTSQEISKIIESVYSDFSCINTFLILDGFDEIGSNHRSNFVIEINKFVSFFPEVPVLVSTRNNFYEFCDDRGENSLFSGFAEIGICPITSVEIKDYLEENGVSYKTFESEVSKQEIYELTSNPFYLKELVTLFKESGYLPKKVDLLDEIINRRFKYDSGKFKNIKTISSFKVMMFACLRKIAFAMQCLQKVELSDDEYQKLFSLEERELMNCAGIISKDSYSNWAFEHNNFREYLAAQFLRELDDFTAFKSVICNVNGTINNSWINVLSFYLLMDPEKEVIELLYKNDISLLVKMEPDKIGSAERDEIFINIFDVLTEKGLWISQGINNAKELAQFCQSPKTLTYLLEIIKKPKHYKAQSNAMNVLSHFTTTTLFDLENDVREVLFECIKSENTEDYKKRAALNCVSSLKLNNKTISTFLIEQYQNKPSVDYRIGMLYYLSDDVDYEDYIDIFINEFTPNADFTILSCCSYYFQHKFKKDSLFKLITYFAEFHDTYSHEKEVCNSLIRNAVSLYNEANQDVYDAIFNAIIVSNKKCNSEFFTNCIEFLKNTGTVKKAFFDFCNKYLTDADNHNIYIMNSIADKECYYELLKLYQINPNKYDPVILRITQSMSQKNEMYQLFVDTLSAQGIVVENSNHFDHEAERKEANRLFFDLLFDKEKLIQTTTEMLKFIGNVNATIEQVDEWCTENHFDFTSKGRLYQKLSDFICVSERRKEKILDVVTDVAKNPYYGISRACSFLNKHNVDLSYEQLDLISNYCNDMLNVIDFSKEIYDNDTNGFTYTYRVRNLMMLSRALDLKYDKSVYKNMLYVPTFIYDERNGASEYDFSQYIKSRLSEIEILSWIQDNAKYGTVCRNIAEICFNYCKEKKSIYAVALAESYCENIDEDNYTKRLAVDYLISIKGYKYVYSKYLYTDDQSLFDAIVELTWEIKDTELRELLEKKTESSDDKLKYLFKLIIMQSEYGVNLCYTLMKSSMNASCVASNNNGISVLEALSTLKSKTFIPLLSKFQELLFSKEFVDIESFGLNSYLSQAYLNIAKENSTEIKNAINEKLKKESISFEEKSFCYSILNSIDSLENTKLDRAWSLKEIQKFFKQVSPL